MPTTVHPAEHLADEFTVILRKYGVDEHVHGACADLLNAVARYEATTTVERLRGAEPGHWIYVTNPITEVVHLTPFVNDGHTLCGKTASVAWAFGDETLSGCEATCGTCRLAAGR